MKKIIFILIIATIVLSIVAISFFFLKDKEHDILSKVPANAKSVMVIDLPGLLTKLVIDDIGSDTSSAAKLSKMLPDSLPDIDLNKSGISFLEKIVLFTTKNESNDSIRLNLILKLANIQEFETFIDSLVENKSLDLIKHKTENIVWSKQYRTIISWNKHFVIASLLSKNQIQDEKNLTTILSLKKEKSILSDSLFINKQSADFDILLYSLPYSNYQKNNSENNQSKYQQFIQSNIKSVVSLINFNDGELKFETELMAKEGSLLEKLFKTPQKELPLLSISDTCALNTVLNINPKALFQIIEQYSSVKLNNEKIPYLALWDGSANIALNGIKIIENEYISYDYDDDFNKIEIRKTVKDKIWDIQTFFGANKTSTDSILQATKLYRSKKDTLLFKGSNFILKNTNEGYLCYNKHVNRPNLSKKVKIANISAELNYKYFIPLLKDFGISTDSLQLSKYKFEQLKLGISTKQHINISLNFYFADKERNSFFSIAESWE